MITRRDKLAEEYGQGQIKNIISPSEKNLWLWTLRQAFKAGFDSRDEEVKLLLDALEKIAGEDFRGPRPTGSVDAYKALRAHDALVADSKELGE